MDKMRCYSEKVGAFFSLHKSYTVAPISLLFDNTISAAARMVYMICHTYCHEKLLSNNPSTFVSQSTIAEQLGQSRVSVTRATKELETNGWITVIRRGQGWSNITILHEKKNQQLEQSLIDEIRKKFTKYE